MEVRRVTRAKRNLSAQYGRSNSINTKKTASPQKTITSRTIAPANSHDREISHTHERQKDIHITAMMGIHRRRNRVQRRHRNRRRATERTRWLAHQQQNAQRRDHSLLTLQPKKQAMHLRRRIIWRRICKNRKGPKRQLR